MAINQDTFNSRITSEALEQKFRDNFPAQGGAELIQDLYASGVIQPIVDFTPTAEGDVLPQNLQTAWDFSTGFNSIVGTSATIITNSGFWLIDVNADGVGGSAIISMTDGLSSKTIWKADSGGGSVPNQIWDNALVVFLRSGDSVIGQSTGGMRINLSYRQIADLNGNVVNPLGFSF